MNRLSKKLTQLLERAHADCLESIALTILRVEIVRTKLIASKLEN